MSREPGKFKRKGCGQRHMPRNRGVRTAEAPPRAVLYARSATEISTAPKAKVEAQIARLRSHAQRRGLKVINVYSDTATTGNGLFRPGILAVLTLASKQPRVFDLLLVMNSSRIGRDVAANALITKALKSAGIRIESCSDAAQTSHENYHHGDNNKFRYQ